MDKLLTQLSSSLHTAETLEQLVRPMLAMLNRITGMESTYLTSIDLSQQVQQVRFALNRQSLQIDEGQLIAWQDSLCKRAYDQRLLACDSVPARWGEVAAARALQIQTFVSAPICTDEGTLIGTLCAASRRQQQLAPQMAALFQLFASIIGNFIERELLVAQLQNANDQLAAYALTDQLTGLPNRRAMFDQLARLQALAQRQQLHVLVGVIDLDEFKQINDQYGHQIGDAFLKAIAQRLQACLRSADHIGRLGGDEFLFIGPGPALTAAPGVPSVDAAHTAAQLQQRLTAATAGAYDLAGQSIDYIGASVGVVAIPPNQTDIEAAIHQADATMYQVKQARKAN